MFEFETQYCKHDMNDYTIKISIVPGIADHRTVISDLNLAGKSKDQTQS